MLCLWTETYMRNDGAQRLSITVRAVLLKRLCRPHCWCLVSLLDFGITQQDWWFSSVCISSQV
jgi:hypothetical protein